MNNNLVIHKLPTDVLLTIISKLTLLDLIKLLTANRFFYQLINNNNQIWKQYYLRTLYHKYIILPNSIHNHCSQTFPILYLYEIKNNKKFKAFGTPIPPDNNNLVNCLQNINYPVGRNHEFPLHTNTIINKNGNIEFYSLKSYDPSNFSLYTKYTPFINGVECKFIYIEKQNINFKKKIGNKPLYHTYQNPKKTFLCSCMNYQPEMFNYVFDKNILQNYKNYYKEFRCNEHQGNLKKNILQNWKEYNKSQNLCQLCQNPTHYDITTMNPPTQCIKFKSFKQVFKINSMANKYWSTRWSIFFKIKRYFHYWKTHRNNDYIN